jgi:ATP-dependent RNA helicase RhlE
VRVGTGDSRKPVVSFRNGLNLAHKEFILTSSTFTTLGLSESLLRALATADYHTPTPIQAQAIPPLLQGRDLLGIAQTGTGKTAAFVLPLLQNLSKNDRRHPIPHSTRALILAPTRELASQISDSISTYGGHTGLRHAVIMGGVSQRTQLKATERGVDILVATPGRLIDLVEQRQIDLGRAAFLVLDEADRMLDMGFIRDVRKLVDLLPKTHQSMLFSATMPQEVARLAGDILRDPVRIAIAAKSVAVDRIEQRVYHADNGAKRKLLGDLLFDSSMSRVIVFTRTKRSADRVARQLTAIGVPAAAMHGDKSQATREKALDAFRQGQSRILVATDIASRGIDIDAISHVINYDLPRDPESYVHRIGRTARAGGRGVAISFCDASERKQLRSIEQLLKERLTVVEGAPSNGNQAKATSLEPHDSNNNPVPSQSVKAKRNRRPRSRGQRQRAA